MDDQRILAAARAVRGQLSGLAVLRAGELGAAEVTPEQKAAAQLAVIRGVEVEQIADGDPWVAGKVAAAGGRVSAGGNIYVCLQTHITQAGWEPQSVPALWAGERQPYAPWVQPQGGHDAYPAGATVTHGGKRWLNTHGDGNIWEPGVFGWTEEV